MSREVESVMRRLECQLTWRWTWRFGLGLAGEAGREGWDWGGGWEGATAGGRGSEGNSADDGEPEGPCVGCDGGGGCARAGDQEGGGMANGEEGVGLQKWGGGGIEAPADIDPGRLAVLVRRIGRGAYSDAGAEEGAMEGMKRSVGVRP